MLKILLDTNIYGKFVEDENNEELIERIESLKNEGKVIILNFRVVRDELRNARATNILAVYDKLTANTIHISDEKVEKLAELYFETYKKKGGIQKKDQNFMNDLRIIAFASIKGLDIICSDDMKAFHKKLAQETYNEINTKNMRRTPHLFTLSDLKRFWL
ncbi:hypothetical protein CMI38_07125 [Candidatus Pacearchaeota archaeon]|jgi:predicted nucleic acid-binding protein|nr:hypothetical protein [Candidatus Pacearchaeota archaeon]|tara:strand:- start:197 stop:676 length:480 start_codon:yes stop_codon:yes gene_type:complete